MKKIIFGYFLQKFVNPNTVNCYKPRKSQYSRCQNCQGIDTYAQRDPCAREDQINEIDRDGSQNTPHDNIQKPLHFFLDGPHEKNNDTNRHYSIHSQRVVNHFTSPDAPQTCGVCQINSLLPYTI